MENQNLVTDKNLIILGGQASGKTTMAMRYARFHGREHTITEYFTGILSFWGVIEHLLKTRKKEVRLIICEGIPNWGNIMQINELVTLFFADAQQQAPQLIFTSNSLRPHTCPRLLMSGKFKAFEMKNGRIVNQEAVS